MNAPLTAKGRPPFREGIREAFSSNCVLSFMSDRAAAHVAERPAGGFDANHASMTAPGTGTQRFSGELLVALAVVKRCIGEFDGGCWFAEQSTGAGKFDQAVAVSQESAMANALKPMWKNMQEKAADKLLRIQAHHLLARVVAVILPAKADISSNEVDQTIVGDSNAVRVCVCVMCCPAYDRFWP